MVYMIRFLLAVLQCHCVAVSTSMMFCLSWICIDIAVDCNQRLWFCDKHDARLDVVGIHQSICICWQLMQYVSLKLFNAGMNFAPHSWHVTSSLCMCPGQLTCAICPEISSRIVLAPSWMCIPHTAQIIPVSSLRIVTTLLVSVTFFLSWISYGGRSRPLHGVTSAWWCVHIWIHNRQRTVLNRSLPVAYRAVP